MAHLDVNAIHLTSMFAANEVIQANVHIAGPARSINKGALRNMLWIIEWKHDSIDNFTLFIIHQPIHLFSKRCQFGVEYFLVHRGFILVNIVRSELCNPVSKISAFGRFNVQLVGNNLICLLNCFFNRAACMPSCMNEVNFSLNISQDLRK